MPAICNYYVTLRSNDTCEFCHAWQEDKYADVREQPYDLSLLKQAGVKVVRFTGGEPLLREGLALILKQAKDLGLMTELSTNGILYAACARQLDKLVDRLFFSLDYPLAEEHDRSRGVECFHEVIRAIELARELRQNPIIKFTLTRSSVLYLPEMVDLSGRLRVLLYLVPVYDFFGTQGFEPATIRHVKYYAGRKNVLINYAALEFTKERGNRTLVPRCRARESTLTILPDGKRVEPCFFNPGGRQGREDVCSSCMRWPYMLPSFAAGLDKYFWLSLYSNFINKRKGLKV